jgi:NAD(P)-dependent dehydrogenase (short-subunit alcohol dehydrogenase family)
MRPFHASVNAPNPAVCRHIPQVPIRYTGDHRLRWAVINMTSNVALMGVAGLDCYTAAKGGTAAITRSMAVEFAP